MLMPLQPFFEEYAKVVREAAREGQKEAKLSIAAAGAEIDRAVLARLREPLLHLVRNAVVHGIEPPTTRRELGKNPVGTVRLEARCEGSRATLRVLDDGAGIDEERVLRKAVASQLIERRDAPSGGAMLEVLTTPGFSTRDVADGLAGRGMGLDVVASTIRDLDGVLRLDNMPGLGCAFTIEVPIAALTSGGLVVRVGDHLVGVLLSHIERAIRVDAASIISFQGRSAILVGTERVAIVPLASLLGVDAKTALAGKRTALVLRHGKQRLVTIVDDIPGQQALIVKPFGKAFARARLFSGGAIQADGSILPVLAVPALFERAAGAAAVQSPAPLVQPAVRPPESISVLVVDDSITMRTLLRNILQASRYKVTVAHDGENALEVLGQMETCDLIITDLHMPRMDGTELCRAVRRRDRPQIPIVVVTSVGDAEEKSRALAAGADAYIVKSDFEQAHFIDTVMRLTGAAGAAA
jgi:chemotaxis protein histidine kinase CheA/CheY-like chemotaxis protein